MATTPGLVSDIVNKAAIAMKTGYDTYQPMGDMFFTDVPKERFDEKFTINAFDGDIPEVADTAAFPEAEIMELGSLTLNQVTYKRKFSASQLAKNYDSEGKLMKAMMRVGMNGRIKSDRIKADVFNNGFTSLTTFDGQPLFDATHTIDLAGNQQSNLTTGALTDTTLNAGIVLGADMKNHEGNEMPQAFRYLLVPTALEKKARELVYSQFNPESANRNENTHAKRGLEVVVWPMLTSTTAWFLVTEKQFNELTCVKGDPFDVQTRPGIYTENNVDEVRLQFSEVAGAPDYFGVVGSTGL